MSASTREQDGVERVRLNQAYLSAIERAGLVPVVVPPLETLLAAGRLLQSFDGLLLTGGEDVDPAHYGATSHPAAHAPHKRRDSWEFALLGEAERHSLPTLAICRGAQLVNVAMGGSLIQDIESEMPAAESHSGAARAARVHEVAVETGSRLWSAVGATRVTVNSSHHQAVARLASGLCVTARASDGVIEGIEPVANGPGAWWLIGVQWHPEELIDTAEDWDRRLFDAFASACVRRAQTRV